MKNKTIVFIYPLDKIKKMFPKLNPLEAMDSEACGIERGWHPNMRLYCGYAYEIDYSALSYYHIYSFCFDKRFTKEISPQELQKMGYKLLEQHFNPWGESTDKIRYKIVRQIPKNSKQPDNILSKIIKQKAGDCHITDRKGLQASIPRNKIGQ